MWMCSCSLGCVWGEFQREGAAVVEALSLYVLWMFGEGDGVEFLMVRQKLCIPTSKLDSSSGESMMFE